MKMFTFIRVLKSTKSFKCILGESASSPSYSIGVLGAPLCKGQPRDGVNEAPDALRKSGLLQELQEIGLNVKDYGNLEFKYNIDNSTNGRLKNPSAVGAACEKVSTAVKNILLDGRKCLTLGGDHSLGMGTVHGHSRVHEVCVLWIDAHPDINTELTSTSGNIHGTPCSFLIKELRKYRSELAPFAWLDACVKKSNFAYIGLRDIDPIEKLILTKEDILHFSMRDIDKLGIFKVINKALDSINPMGNLSLHVSFDIDSVDKMSTPSTGTPVIGGLTVREALCLAEEVSHRNILQALDLVEINPQLGSKEQVRDTLTVAKLITKTFFGYSRMGHLPSNMKDIPTE